MSRYWSELVRKIEPYVPGEQPKDKKYIKLNTNESPYPPSPKVTEAIRNAADDSLRLYPDPECSELKNAVAEYYGLGTEQVFVGNGSDEVLAFAFMAFFNPGRPILYPDITYSFYPVYSRLFNIDYKLIPLDDQYAVQVEGFFQENGGIIIANPNAPTAKYLELDSIERIVKHNQNSVVIIDEAYIDFGGESAVRLIDTYENLIVIQTLSKSRSLAGLRVGFAIGDRELVEALDRIKNSVNSYTLDRLALVGATEAIRDKEYFETTRNRIIATRERVTLELRQMGFRVVDSRANFVFISHPDKNAGEIFISLREKGILVRYFEKPRIDNFLRVSIGSDKEMDCFIDAVRSIVER